jgi:hypothetical protein
MGIGDWGLGIGDWDVSVRDDGNTFFVFSQILSPSNAPYGLGIGDWVLGTNDQ